MDNNSTQQVEIPAQETISPGLARIKPWGEKQFSLETPYSPALVEDIRALEDREWDRNRKVWIIARKHENELRGLVRKYFRFEDEKDVPPALLPRFERQQVVIVTRRQIGYFSYGQVSIDGFKLIDPETGDLRLKPNPSFRIVSFEGSATVRSMNRQFETNVDVNGNWIEEGLTVTVTEQWQILRYSIVIISRVGAEWTVVDVGGDSSDASYKFLGQKKFLGDPITDIEIGDFEDLSGLPAVGIHEYDIELVGEEGGEPSLVAVGESSTLPLKVPTNKRFRMKVREAQTREEVLESLEFLRQAVELAGGRLIGDKPQYYRSEKRWGCWFTVERPAGSVGKDGRE